jgi:hypothetical protein
MTAGLLAAMLIHPFFWKSTCFLGFSRAFSHTSLTDRMHPKFLTGPAFSGALLLPRHLLARASAVSALLDQSPAVGSKQEWSAAWQQAFSFDPASVPVASFGPLFRWLPVR